MNGGAPAPTLVRALLAAIAVTTVGVLPSFLTGALAVQVKADLGFGAAGLGLAVGAFFATASVASVAFGRATERLGSTRSLRAAALASAGALALVSVAARSLASLVGLLALAGLANALAQPAANLFLARSVPPTRQGLAFGVKQSAIPTAILLGGLAVPAVALTVGWRWAYVGGAVLAVGAAASVPGLEPRRGRGAAGDRPRPDVRALVVLGLGIGLGAAAAGSLGTFLVSALVAAGLADGTAGLVVAGGSAVGLVVRLLSGVRADRREGGHLRVVAVMLVLGAGAFVLLATASAPVMLVATPLAFATGWGWPGLFNLAIVRRFPEAPGAATGITQTGTYIGAVAGPLAFGVVAEATSYQWSWVLAAICSLASAAAMVVGRRRLRSRPR
ncbi:MAG: MFS transporter [Acidimicrobiales bacterium]|nr:MFS transporter [Acidimicrobiales bacterium]